jgi:hypothetical protein
MAARGGMTDSFDKRVGGVLVVLVDCDVQNQFRLALDTRSAFDRSQRACAAYLGVV